MQETNKLPSFCRDHSPILFSYCKSFQITLGRNFWKSNNLLVQDETYILNMKEHIKYVKTSLYLNFDNNEHSKWEFLKYEIQKFTVEYSKNKAKLGRKKSFLENKGFRAKHKP